MYVSMKEYGLRNRTHQSQPATAHTKPLICFPRDMDCMRGEFDRHATRIYDQYDDSYVCMYIYIYICDDDDQIIALFMVVCSLLMIPFMQFECKTIPFIVSMTVTMHDCHSFFIRSMGTSLYIYIYICICIYMYVCMYVCMYVTYR